ncbi:alpha-glucan family phosphorylase [Chloroflexota bacterium]
MGIFKSAIPNHFDLPSRISRLGELAYNLWWTWNPGAQHLFDRIDLELWERLNHNPLLFLRQVGRKEINMASQDKYYLSIYDRIMTDFDDYLSAEDTWFSRSLPENNAKTVAYFSMEFGLHETLPIYSGGLGVLSGDHLKGASDLGLNLVGIGILYGEGYFSQQITEDGWQVARNNPIIVANLPILPVLNKEGKQLAVSIPFPNRDMQVNIWELRIGRVPLYLLDSNHPENTATEKQLTSRLYWSDLDLRIMQEILLGMGGVRALRALELDPNIWHMNEGHAAFLILERTRELIMEGATFQDAIESTRKTNVFTTHTPVPAGNDEFPIWLVEKYLSRIWIDLDLSREQFVNLASQQSDVAEVFSMPTLALRHSAYRNGVSELHGKVARRMWHHLWPKLEEDDVPISSITNGVHTTTWLARRQRMLYDRHLRSNWQEKMVEPETWDQVEDIPDDEIWDIHQHQKRKLAFHLQGRARDQWMNAGSHPVQIIASGALLDPYALTIGFARRFATYKRANLIFNDLDRLFNLLNTPNKPLQIIFAGKAHPADEPGKLLIQEVYRIVKDSRNGGRLVFLDDYDMNLARYLVQGVDVWLNTPCRPNEASGTSGMKAAMNGVLNVSVLDGWWREAFNGNNGWAIGQDTGLSTADTDLEDAASLYHILENEIIPLFYHDRGSDRIPHQWVTRMKESIRTITPRFSMRRMLQEYTSTIYFPTEIEIEGN